MPTEDVVVTDQVASHSQAGGNDEFGEFIIDFDKLDGQIEQKLKNPVSKPPRQSFGDPFGDAFDFSELDKTIAARKPKIIVKAQKPTYRVDMRQFELPPI